MSVSKKNIDILQLESSIQINQHDIGNFGKEMAILIKQQREAINWEQFKPDALWTHLAKVGCYFPDLS
jgi:hypothetical protein